MIIDTGSNVTTHLPALNAVGVVTVIRYLNPLNPSGEKCIKPPEAHAIAAARLRLALVCEGWGDFAHGGITAGAGERDGAWCANHAPGVGAPPEACIYYAVDVDATAAQIASLVIPYFRSVRAATAHRFRVGVYGSGAVCAAVTAAGLADLSWLAGALGWSGSRAYLASNRWALRQHLPQKIAGLDCDRNEAHGDFGDFAPFAHMA